MARSVIFATDTIITRNKLNFAQLQLCVHISNSTEKYLSHHLITQQNMSFSHKLTYHVAVRWNCHETSFFYHKISLFYLKMHSINWKIIYHIDNKGLQSMMRVCAFNSITSTNVQFDDGKVSFVFKLITKTNITVKWNISRMLSLERYN